MPDIFRSPKIRLAQAKVRIDEFNREIRAFIGTEPCARVVEPDPNTPEKRLHKLKVVKSVPDPFEALVAEIAEHLRSVLDQSMHAVANAARLGRRDCYFPFSSDAPNFENTLRGRAKDFPNEIITLLRTFKPYKGGNNSLWALNAICNTGKHWKLTPVGIAISAMSGQSIFRADAMRNMLFVPVWDSVKHEMIFASALADDDFEYDFNFEFFVAFDEIEIIGGQNAVGILHQMANVVEGILLSIEAESRRIGLIA